MLKQTRLSVSKVSKKEWDFIYQLEEPEEDNNGGVELTSASTAPAKREKAPKPKTEAKPKRGRPAAKDKDVGSAPAPVPSSHSKLPDIEEDGDGTAESATAAAAPAKRENTPKPKTEAKPKRGKPAAKNVTSAAGLVARALSQPPTPSHTLAPRPSRASRASSHVPTSFIKKAASTAGAIVNGALPSFKTGPVGALAMSPVEAALAKVRKGE